MTSSVSACSVFINCPFDEPYQAFFDAIVFTVARCGFVARCAMEIDDAASTRIEKIVKLIRDCPYSIHDLSRTELSSTSGLPRFNMPFELGLFLGAQRYGPPAQRNKRCLVMDKQAYRYQQFISDIAGQDVWSHENKVDALITRVRHFLRTLLPKLPGPKKIYDDLQEFNAAKPRICEELELNPTELAFVDFTYIVAYYLKSVAA
jgi:hypothetical protein